MKMFTTNNGNLYIGTGRELLPIYRSIVKAYHKGTTDIWPVVSNMPYTWPDNMYGLEISSRKAAYWLSANTALTIIAVETV